MSSFSVDPAEVLQKVRNEAIAIVEACFPEVSALLDRILPDPLSPTVLLPLAVGIGAGGDIDVLVPVAAAVLLVDVSLRTIDDCADGDDENALYRRLGIGRAANFAMALNTTAAFQFSHIAQPPRRRDAILNEYFHSFIDVCRGQDQDMLRAVQDVEEYQEIVRLKTVAAYRFAAWVGAQAVTSDHRLLAHASECGSHLGWMTQVLNDLEAVWFSPTSSSEDFGSITGAYPVLVGLTLDHPNAQLLAEWCHSGAEDVVTLRTLLDEMELRPRLVQTALDHRDAALAALEAMPHPAGRALLGISLDWLLRDGERIVGVAEPTTVVGQPISSSSDDM